MKSEETKTSGVTRLMTYLAEIWKKLAKRELKQTSESEAPLAEEKQEPKTIEQKILEFADELEQTELEVGEKKYAVVKEEEWETWTLSMKIFSKERVGKKNYDLYACASAGWLHEFGMDCSASLIAAEDKKGIVDYMRNNLEEIQATLRCLTALAKEKTEDDCRPW